MDHHSIFLVALFFLGLVGSWVGGMISGGVSLVSVTGMLLLGIPPQITMSTYFIGSLGSRIGHFREYYKADKVVWRLVIPLSIATLAGSLLGAHILVSTSDQTATTITNYVLLFFVPLAFIKRRMGVKRIVVSQRRELTGFAIYFLLAIWTSFFAAWAGLLMLYVYLTFFGLTILETKGTDSIPGTFLDIGATIVFLHAGTYDLSFVAAFCPGMVLGTILGVRSALRLGDARLQVLVWVSVSVVCFKVLIHEKMYRHLSVLFSLLGLR
jgi:uncharacterized membrane protein YfcA